MNTQNCINIETPLGSKCYKCSNPSAMPAYVNESSINDTNMGKIICNSKPFISFGYKKDSLVPVMYTGSFQCNGTESAVMVKVPAKTDWSSGDEIKGYFEPRCQQILPL